MNRESATEVFAALGDPTRQHLLELLAEHGRASATTLAAPLGVTRQAVHKHLQVLEQAGLVSAGRRGREVLYTVRTEQLGETARWMAALASQWDARLAAIKRLAEET